MDIKQQINILQLALEEQGKQIIHNHNEIAKLRNRVNELEYQIP